MAVYGISDTHFSHRNILQYRPGFSSIEEHDEIIKDNILSVVGKRDSLYILGDVCLHRDGWKHVEEIASRIEYLHICLGNHDCERSGSPRLEEYIELCKTVFSMKSYKGAWLTHAPLHPDELRGRINIHGHVHANSIDDERYINISCEVVEYMPINFASLSIKK